MINQQLLQLLRCPQSGTPLTLAPSKLIEQLNRRVQSRSLKNLGGAVIERPLGGGLIREAGDLVYPIFDDIPVMLRDEAIPFESADATAVG